MSKKSKSRYCRKPRRKKKFTIRMRATIRLSNGEEKVVTEDFSGNKLDNIQRRISKRLKFIIKTAELLDYETEFVK